MKNTITLLLILISSLGFSQVLLTDETGEQTPDSHAVLELKSANKGLLLPRLTTAPTTPVAGLVYFDLQKKCMRGWDGNVWQELAGDCIESPVASNLTITEDTTNSNNDGFIQAGETILANYDYSDPIGNNPEGSSTITWYITDGFSEFAIGTGNSLATDSFMQGSQVKFCVTPKDNLGNEGENVCSNYSLISIPISNVPARINEIHYRNNGTDMDEFIEIRLPLDYDTSMITIELINGNGNVQYDYTDLIGANVTKYSDANYDYYVWRPSSIQNGAPDGVYLSKNNEIIDFISYEGVMVYNTVTSTDIGVKETTSTPVGSSIQRSDDGDSWTLTEGFNSLGQANFFTAPAPDTVVQFVSSNSTLAEDGMFIDIELSITDPDATNATTVEIALNAASTATNGTDYDDGATTPAAIVFPQTITFPAGSSANQSITIYISNDDTEDEGNETVVLDLQNVSGGNNAMLGTVTSHTLTIIDNDNAAVTPITYTQNFETTPDANDLPFTVSGSGGSYATGDGAYPNSPKYVSGSRGYQVKNSGSSGTTLSFGSIDFTGYSTVTLTFRLASFSATSGNGADATDYVNIEVSTDGGTTMSREMTINPGNSNFKWDFNASGTATTAYDGDNTATAVTSQNGATGISTVTISGIPATNAVKANLVLRNNDSNEFWVIDDVQLTGE